MLVSRTVTSVRSRIRTCTHDVHVSINVHVPIDVHVGLIVTRSVKFSAALELHRLSLLLLRMLRFPLVAQIVVPIESYSQKQIRKCFCVSDFSTVLPRAAHSNHEHVW